MAPLPAGAPVTVLVEETSTEYVIWEMASGDRRFIGYEQMRAVRLRQQRAHRVVSRLIAVACLPFVLAIAVWLWKELAWFIRRSAPAAPDGSLLRIRGGRTGRVRASSTTFLIA